MSGHEPHRRHLSCPCWRCKAKRALPAVGLAIAVALSVAYVLGACYMCAWSMGVEP